jgi:hypothetical protein
MRKLQNGAYVIAQHKIDSTASAVLCWWERGEFIVWYCDEQENAYAGSYTNSWNKAQAVFMKRANVTQEQLTALVVEFQEDETVNCDAFNDSGEFHEQAQRSDIPSFYAEYLACKARGAYNRASGWLSRAKIWEDTCDKLYAQMPEPFRW